MPAPRLRSRRRGFSMIEILVTLVIVAFGLLGLAGFITRASALSVDTALKQDSRGFG